MRHDIGDSVEERGGQEVFVDHRAGGLGEFIERAEQSCPLLQGVLLAFQDEGDRQSFGDGLDQAQVGRRQRHLGRRLDRQDSDRLAVDAQGDRDLARDVRLHRLPVGVGVVPLEKSGAGASKDTSDNADRRVEIRRAFVIADRGTELEPRTALDEQGEVRIAHPIRQRGEDGRHRFGREAGLREQRSDGLDPAHRLVAAALLRDVDAGADQVGGTTLVVEEADVRPGDQAEPPVAGDPVVLVLRRELARTQAGEILADHRNLGLGDQELVEGAAADFLHRVSGHELAGPIESEDSPLAIEHAEQGAGNLQDRVDESPFFSLFEAFLDDRSDIRDRPDVARHLAVGGAN